METKRTFTQEEAAEIVASGKGAYIPAPIKAGGWEERFDDKFLSREADWTDYGRETILKVLKSFIASELELAREEGRNEAADYMRNAMYDIDTEGNHILRPVQIFEAIRDSRDARSHSKGEFRCEKGHPLQAANGGMFCECTGFPGAG
jgi:hypothetical protein